jgi:Flp pilus assembly protein TadG
MGLIDRRYLKEEVSAVRTIIRNQRGAALVEFAIVALLLFTLLFGIIEFGLIIKDYLTLSQAAREGARCAALRGTVAEVTERVENSAAGFSQDQIDALTVTPGYRVQNNNGTWPTTWIEDALPAANSPDQEVQVKVRVTYPHPTITGSLFGLGSTIMLSGNMVMRREGMPPPAT